MDLHRRPAALVAVALTLLLPAASPARAADPPDLTAEIDEVERVLDDGRYAESERMARELLPRIEERYGSGSAEVATLLNWLVEAMWRGGKANDEALAFARRGVAIREEVLGEHRLLGQILLNEGNVLLMSGRFAEALPVYERARELQERILGPDHYHVGVSLNNIGTVHQVLSNFAEARAAFERALEILRGRFGPDHYRVGAQYASIAHLLSQQGDLDAARSYHERSLAILEQTLGEDHPRVVIARAHLAGVVMRQGRYELGLRMSEELLDTATAALGPEHYEVLQLRNRMGEALWHLGQLDRARELFRDVVAIRERIGPDHPFIGAPLINYGRTLFDDGRFEEALPLYRRALEVRERWTGEDNLPAAAARTYLADLYLATGKPMQALDEALGAERIARDRFREIAASLSETEALRYESVRASGLDAAVAALAAFGGDARNDVITRVWEHLVRSRAVVLDEVAARRRALTERTDDEVAARAEELRAARNALARLVVRGPGDDREAYLEELRNARERRERAERALADESLELRRRRARAGIGLNDVIAALPPNTALVSYVEYERVEVPPREPGADANEARRRPEYVTFYLALVLPAADAGPRVVALGPAARIDALVGEWREQAGSRPPTVPLAARRAEARYREAASTLREALWDPVLEQLEGARQVLVVPDGAIHLVSLDTLVATDGTYLIEGGPRLHYLSAERDIVRPLEPPPAGRGLLALGGPDFGPVPKRESVASARSREASCDGLDSLSFDPLPASRAEVTELAGLWSERLAGDDDGQVVRTLTGDAASEAKLRAVVSGRRVLHLATHGFFEQGRCGAPDRPAFGRRITETSGRDTALRVLNDPLLLSGLALAGANAPGDRDERPAADDGFLTAEEIATLDLHGTEWVVLSACETGVGEVLRGGGVLGLRRAFETAGVGTLIMSLWSVEDEATRSWMRALYRRRLDGSSTSEAMRAAGLAELAARRAAGRSTHPFYWGAFVAVGDWR